MRRRAPRPIPRLALAAALLLGLAACESVPRPFRHDEAGISALARPKLGRGVALRLADDLPRSEALAEAVIKAFEDREVPVTLRHGPGFGRVIEAEADGSAILWRLRDADGTALTSLTTPATASAKATALQVASQVHPLLEDPDAKPRPVAGVTLAALPKVRLAPVKGLPGDGDSALPQALVTALGRQRVAVADDAPYIVVGVVTITPAGTTEDTVTVSWLLKRGETGGPQLARVDQGGTVPRGRLNLPWGSLARDIAEGGAASIAEVVRLDDRNRQNQENAAGSRQFTEPGTADIGKPDSTEQSNPARTSPPPPAEPTPPMAAGSSAAPPPATPAPTGTVAPGTPKPAKAAAKSKVSAKKSPSPAKAKQARPAPRTKPDR